MKEKGLQNKVL